MTKPQIDPAIRTVREAREAISRQFGNDPRRLVEHYLAMQMTFDGEIIVGPEHDVEVVQTADAMPSGR